MNAKEMIEAVINGEDPRNIISDIAEAKSKFKVGDLVKYTKKFLQSTGSLTGDIPRMVGKVTKIGQLSGKHVEVHWAGEDEKMLVAEMNLQKTKKPWKAPGAR